MKRKIALMMSSVLLCAAIFGGCATYDAVDTAFTAFNDGNIYEQLTSPYGEQFPADAAQYAIDNMTGVDWNANALAKAKDYYYTFSMSKSGVYEQLVSEYGEQFTESEAQYAIDHLED